MSICYDDRDIGTLYAISIVAVDDLVRTSMAKCMRRQSDENTKILGPASFQCITFVLQARGCWDFRRNR